jgi:hypothetical protein
MIEHTDQLLNLIERRVTATNADLLALLDRVRHRLAQLAVDPAKLAGPALTAIVDQILAEMAVAARRAVRAGSDKDRVGELLKEQATRVSGLSRSLRAAERPTLAKALLVLQAAHTLASGLKGTLSDAAVQGQTKARRSQLADQGRAVVLMWVPERDACARCLRYAGLRLLRPTDAFPAGLSYDPQQADSGAGDIPGPPLHPHCRCELQVVSKGDSEDASQALQREAERAVLKGWALASEGAASRERAARALLAAGASVPKSVKAEALKRLKEGERFTRPVPSGHEPKAKRDYLASYSGVYRR